MHRLTTSLLALWVLLGNPQNARQPRLDPRIKEELKAYLSSHYMTPEDYILSKFRDHDIVFLGEFHRIKHDVELVQQLIPRLYDHKIYTLGTEFARREDQPLIDRLLNRATYDESLARQITFNQFVHWGFQEYVDIFKAAWELNHTLPKNSRRFRILGLNDSPDWSVLEKPEDRDNPELRRKVWRGGGEHLYAKVILDEVVAKGEKALVYSGIHHAFTEYKQPTFNEAKQAFVRFDETRMGNYVYRAVGKRAITIYLHAVWAPAEGYSRFPMVNAADGYIDAVMAEIEPTFRRAGFDTRGTPFGKVPGETSIYKHGYEHFTLEAFCDGYIFQKPLSEYEGVTPIKDFINKSNIQQAQLQSPNPNFRNRSIEDFNRAIAGDAQVPRNIIRAVLGNK